MAAPSMERRSSMADFVVAQKLGSGSYGNVFKVQRKADKQFYAVKEVNIRKLQPREREDAINEIRILASIKHKNICRYCDAFIEKDNLYIVMEFAEHGDISRQIEKFKKANKYIKEDTIWSYAIQICQGLQGMHSRNVLHRDIKAKNIFLTGKNHVRLGDLGCAKLMKAGMARTQIGTPYYMSPEIWANKPYDVKSDIWAVGCLLYELAMLSPPFVANDMNGLALKIKTTTAPRISKHYSEDLGNLVASMLKPDPRARPTVDQIMTMPCVLSKIASLPAEEEGAWVGEEMRSHMIATIRVPYGFGVGGMKAGNGGLNLPAPCYPQARPQTSPGKVSDNNNNNNNNNNNAVPSTAAVVPSSVPAVPFSSAASEPSAAAARAAAFAACTSPPQLGRAQQQAKENNNNYNNNNNNNGKIPTAAPGNAAVVIAKRPLSAAAGNAANALVAAAPRIPGKPGGVVAGVNNVAAIARPGGAVAAPIVGGIARPGAVVVAPGAVGAFVARPGAIVPSNAGAPDLRKAAAPSAYGGAAVQIARVGGGALGVPVGGVYGGVAAAARFGGVGVVGAVVGGGGRAFPTRPW